LPCQFEPRGVAFGLTEKRQGGGGSWLGVKRADVGALLGTAEGLVGPVISLLGIGSEALRQL